MTSSVATSAMESEITFRIMRCFIKCIADDKEELSREAFDKVFNNFVEVILVSSKVDENIVSKLKESSLQFGVLWNPTAEVEEKFKRDFVEKAKKSFPVIGTAIFRFFDRDGNGTISCDEIMFVLKLIVKLGDSAQSEVPLYERLKDIADAFFRVFDANDNGEIETSEVNTIIKDIVEGFFNMMISLYDLFRTYILDEHLDHAVEVYCDRLKLQLGEEPFQLDKVVKFNVSFVPSDEETLPKMGEKLRKNAAFVENLASSDAEPGLAKSKFNGFFQRFKEQAIDDKLGKSECIEIAAACACELFDASLRFDQLEGGLSSGLGVINGMLSSKLPGSPQEVVEKDKLVEVFKEMAASFRSHVLNGGLKRYLACLFDMLDVNNDGMLCGAELNALGFSIGNTLEHGLKPGLEDKLAENQHSLYNFMDADSDGLLTRQEIHMFANKMCELVFALIALMLESVKELTSMALPALVTILFKVKAAVMGGSDTSLAMSDFTFLSSKMQKDSEAEQLRWSNKEFVLEQVQCNPEGLEKASVELKADREVVLAAVTGNGLTLQHASSALKSDRELVLVAVRQNGDAIQYAGEQLRMDKEVVLAALNERRRCWEHIPSEMKEDKEIVITAISSTDWDAVALYNIPERFLGDKDVILAAVSVNWCNLAMASRALRADKDVVMAAIANNGSALTHASQALRNDKEVVLKAVTAANCPCLEAASDALKADREVVLAAVQTDGGKLFYAAEKFWADREVVMLALQTGGTYEIVADSLRDDREIALLAAVKNGYNNYKHLPDKFKLDKAFILEAISQGFDAASLLPKQMLADKSMVLAMVSLPNNGGALSYAAEELRDDVDVVAAAAAATPSALSYASDRVRNDRNAVMRIVAGAGKALEQVGAALQDDAEVVATAVKNDWEAFQYASERLRGDEAAVLAALDCSGGQALRHGTTELRERRDFILVAVGKYGDALEYASTELRGDREVVLKAVSVGGGAALGYASEELRSDPQVCKAATDRNPGAKRYVCKELGGDGEEGEMHVLSCTIA